MNFVNTLRKFFETKQLGVGSQIFCNYYLRYIELNHKG